MRSSAPEAEIRIPVSTGRVSSREAERATREIVSTKAPAESLTRDSPPGSGSDGKSSARSVRRWNVVGPQISSMSCSAPRSSIVSCSAGSERATSRSSRAGSTAAPGRATSALRGVRSPISMSVASSSGVPSAGAEIITPESACTALRVDATREAVCSWVNSSEEDREIFIRLSSWKSDE